MQVDAALRQTVALLELVRQEEALLGWLDDCVAQLHAVRRARQTLLDLTDAELTEAHHLTDVEANAEAGEDGGADSSEDKIGGPAASGTAARVTPASRGSRAES